MTFKLYFLESAKKEWDLLAEPIRKQFKKKLEQRIINPCVPKDKLSGLSNCYKIKLRQVGYRLVYKVSDTELIITVIAVGKRDKSIVYKRV
jgi:mRNA interferase RelE/StbE